MRFSFLLCLLLAATSAPHTTISASANTSSTPAPATGAAIATTGSAAAGETVGGGEEVVGTLPELVPPADSEAPDEVEVTSSTDCEVVEGSCSEELDGGSATVLGMPVCQYNYRIMLANKGYLVCIYSYVCSYW